MRSARLGLVTACLTVALCWSAASSNTAIASFGDCGQPVTSGIMPAATDCLFILQAGIGTSTCDYDCLCDVDSSTAIVATDALACLNRATGQSTRLVCACETPALHGLDSDKSMILPILVQAAFNDDTMFFHVTWEGDRGDVHDYLHYTGGQWVTEGGHRRDGQSTIDNDPDRGRTDVTSTVYESRVTFFLDDPNGANAVPDFDRYGCFLTCHDSSRNMPTWDAVSDRTKYLNDDTTGTLDLWHHRLSRANPIGVSDDFHVTRIPPGGEETGGRLRDAGSGPWQTNARDGNGDPAFVFDPASTAGLYAFKFAGLYTDPMRFIRQAVAPADGAQPVAFALPFADAVGAGYTPQEGDTVPVRILRTPTGSAGDITAYGTTFTPSSIDPLFGTWESNTQRLLATGNGDDTDLVPGDVYNIAFAVHTGKVTVRDHYVGFPMTLSMGPGVADIEAVQVAGSGRETLPDFADEITFPPVATNLFLPGIASLEFLINENAGLTYIDPVDDTAVDQNHAGANALLVQGLGCRDCHTAASADPFAPTQPGGFNSGSMEALAGQRGGVNTPTPIPPAAQP